MARSTCQYTDITESFCLLSSQWHEVGPPVTDTMTWGHPTALKNVYSLLNTRLVHTASQHLQGLWISPRGDSPVLCCINKENACRGILTLPKYLQSTLAANAKGLKGQRENEVIQREEAAALREGGGEGGGFAGISVWAGGLLRNGHGASPPWTISHVSSLFSSPSMSAISTNVKIQGKQTNAF